MINTAGYEKHYSEGSFWSKIFDCFKKAGRHVIEKALWLYYASQNPQTPLWAKSVIFAALGYFISPIDAIPDITPVVGYVDDIGVLTAAVATVSMYIDDEVVNKTNNKLREWFGA